jgi:hypothetical protein
VLGLVCLRGKPIVWDNIQTVTLERNGEEKLVQFPVNKRAGDVLRVAVQQNVLGVTMCQRCSAVFFRCGTKRFICELLRQGHHPLSMYERNPKKRVQRAFGPQAIRHVTNGCTGYFLQTGGDCFEMLAKDIDVTY